MTRQIQDNALYNDKEEKKKKTDIVAWLVLFCLLGVLTFFGYAFLNSIQNF